MSEKWTTYINCKGCGEKKLMLTHEIGNLKLCYDCRGKKGLCASCGKPLDDPIIALGAKAVLSRYEKCFQCELDGFMALESLRSLK